MATNFVGQKMQLSSFARHQKTSNDAFQAFWVEFSFVKQKKFVGDIIHRQHNSPDRFLEYLKEIMEKMSA